MWGEWKGFDVGILLEGVGKGEVMVGDSFKWE